MAKSRGILIVAEPVAGVSVVVIPDSGDGRMQVRIEGRNAAFSSRPARRLTLVH